MGSYVYKVTSEEVTLSNGEKANRAVFAYKPYRDFWGDAAKANARMAFRSGVYTHDNAAAKGKRHRWVVMGGSVLCFPKPVGSFDDDYAVEKYAVTGVSIVG